ncbi:MAG: hypothetical protein FJ265_17565 [Planctomycetes bacterium]|nr:hypothetical protein [Planctomycetota bacterium]
MPTTRSSLFPLFPFPLLAAALCAQQPQHLVAPAAYANQDAISYGWIAGASQDLRQQTLVGASHLQALLGRELLALELRRTAANEVYQGGTANLTVVLSTAPHGPLQCDSAWLGNVGPDALQVHSGAVVFPTSPATTGPNVGWTPQNVLRIPFTVPFVYRGGTLCIDVVGQPIAGQNVNWWMADGEFEDLMGSAVEVGSGCGLYGGPQHRWSYVAERTLLPGAHARFWAHGPQNGFGMAVFGAPSPTPIPLTALGLNAPGCDMHLQPGLVLSTLVARFVPEVHPLLLSRPGCAEARLRIPASPWVFGLTLATQWLDLSQPATSNTIEWTVGSQIPSLDMTLVEGHPGDPRGEVSVHFAHVWRFEYR